MRETGEAVQSGRSYRFLPDVGFHAVDEAVDDRLVFGGATLHAIAADDYAQDTVRRAAKQIMRRALAPHLGDRPIGSRALYQRHSAS